MDKFIDLDVSFFDPKFTLSPEEHLAELYPRKDILGFRSEGMNFVFRFDEARAIMFNRECAREPLANPEIAEREARLAAAYPNRAKNFQLVYNFGTPNLQLKKLLVTYIGQIADAANFESTHAVYRQLSVGGRLDNYIDDVCTLPLRIMMDSCGLPYSEEQLFKLYRAGFDFLKALENFGDESLLGDADRAIAYIWNYLEEFLPGIPRDAPVSRFMAEGAELGIDRETLVVNVAAFFIVSLSNTAGISSAYLLRNLVRFPEVRTALAEQPGLLDDDNTIIEFLRRDNHVKSMSRQAHEPFELNGHAIKKGDSINIFFPGVNLDPGHWSNPLGIDLSRKFAGPDNIIFVGSMYLCIGKYLGIAFLRHMTRGFLDNLPDTARIVDDEIEVDGDWVSERIITCMPIELD